VGDAERPALRIDGATGGSEALSRAEEDPVLNPVQNETVDEMQKRRNGDGLLPDKDEEDGDADGR